MGLEIEKKYRLSDEDQARLLSRLAELSTATFRGEEYERNTLFAGPNIDPQRQVLRLRVVDQRAVLTYKERYPSTSSIKSQREDETEVADAKEMTAVLEGLGYKPSLIYEKRRRTWTVGDAEVVLDELPFGLFAEIEGEEEDIISAESSLDLSQVPAEMKTYPELAAEHGMRIGEMIESRF